MRRLRIAAPAAVVVAAALIALAVARRQHAVHRISTASGEWFPFTPAPDPFTASAIDLRGLNEPQAGQGGFIQTRGDHFVHAATGQPVRFWAVNARPPVLRYDRDGLDRLARFLAKRGVNLVRFQGPLWKDDDLSRIDPAKLDRVHALEAALRAQGIYLAISTYFPLWLHPAGGPGFEGYDGKQVPFGLPFFSPAFQALQRSWLHGVLAPANPYTGLPLARDPALAFVEILNEDGLFFWTFEPYQTVPAPQMLLLESQFGDWLQRKYGPLAGTFARWGGQSVRGDDVAAGRAGVMTLRQLIDRRDARAQDTAAFLADLQRRYFDGMAAYVKGELGFQGIVIGSNWVTGDPRTLGPLDKWSNAGCDAMDRHGYFEGLHQGERATYAISPGDRVQDAVALRFETGKKGGDRSFSLPIMDVAYNGKPSMLSEVGWLPPNRFRADLPLVAAAYGALQGTDAIVFFTIDDDGWSPEIKKFTLADPVGMGQFPAAALIYRQGLVRTAQPVVHLEVDLASLQRLQPTPIAPPENLDSLRSDGVVGSDRRTDPTRIIDPLAPLAGRVEVNVGSGGGATSIASDLARLIDHQAGTVRSQTGELLWDWQRGLVTVNAPSTQGATGLLRAAGVIATDQLSIASDNDYGTILAVALDGATLAGSRRILLQVMTEDANSGWTTTGAGPRTITAVGGPPILVRKVAGRVTFRRPDAGSLRVTPLDFNGYAAGAPAPLSAAGDLTLLPNTFYYLIERP